MELQDQVWIAAMVIFVSAIVALAYAVYKRKGKTDHLVQGGIAVFASLVSLVSLFYPWIILLISEDGRSPRILQLTGMNIGEAFVYVTDTQIVRVVALFLLLLVNLSLVNGFIRMAGYELARTIIILCSGLAIFLSGVVVLLLGAFPVSSASVTFQMYPWAYMTGAVVSLIGAKLQREK